MKTLLKSFLLLMVISIACLCSAAVEPMATMKYVTNQINRLDRRIDEIDTLVDTNSVKNIVDSSFIGGTQNVNRIISSFNLVSNRVYAIESQTNDWNEVTNKVDYCRVEAIESRTNVWNLASQWTTNVIEDIIDSSFNGGTQKVNRVIGSFDNVSNRVVAIESKEAIWDGKQDKIDDYTMTNDVKEIALYPATNYTDRVTSNLLTNDVAALTNSVAFTNAVRIVSPSVEIVAPTNDMSVSGKAADAYETGIALTNRYTKDETDGMLATNKVALSSVTNVQGNAVGAADVGAYEIVDGVQIFETLTSNAGIQLDTDWGGGETYSATFGADEIMFDRFLDGEMSRGAYGNSRLHFDWGDSIENVFEMDRYGFHIYKVGQETKYDMLFPVGRTGTFALLEDIPPAPGNYASVSNAAMWASNGVVSTGSALAGKLGRDECVSLSSLTNAAGAHLVSLKETSPISPLLNGWVRSYAPAGTWRAIIYSDGMYLAANKSTDSGIYWSRDGVSWNLTDQTDGSFFDLCRGDDGFYAASGNDGVWVSQNGTNWVKSLPSGKWFSLACGGGVVVAGSYDTQGIWYKEAGEEWKQASGASGGSWRKILYGNGVFVATAYSGKSPYTGMWLSSDGKSWRQSSDLKTGRFVSATFDGSRFFAVDSKHALYKSLTGDFWGTPVHTFSTDVTLLGSGDGYIAGVVNGGLYASGDGVKWERCSLDSGSWYACAFGGGKCLVGGNSTGIWYADLSSRVVPVIQGVRNGSTVLQPDPDNVVDISSAIAGNYANVSNAAMSAIQPWQMSHTNETFSAEVLAVSLDFTTNTTGAAYVAVTNALAGLGFNADVLAEIPGGGVYGSIGALLAALAAAVAWLRKNKIDKLKVTGMTAEATAENGVAKLDDFFTESNSLLTGTIAANSAQLALDEDGEIIVTMNTED